MDFFFTVNISKSLLLFFVDQSSGRSPVSPGFPQPLRFTPEGGPGKLRPVSTTVIQDVCFVCLCLFYIAVKIS